MELDGRTLQATDLTLRNSFAWPLRNFVRWTVMELLWVADDLTIKTLFGFTFDELSVRWTFTEIFRYTFKELSVRWIIMGIFWLGLC